MFISFLSEIPISHSLQTGAVVNHHFKNVYICTQIIFLTVRHVHVAKCSKANYNKQTYKNVDRITKNDAQNINNKI